MAASPGKRFEHGFGTAPSLLPHALILTNDQRVAFKTRDKAVRALRGPALSHEERALVLRAQHPLQPPLPPPHGEAPAVSTSPAPVSVRPLQTDQQELWLMPAPPPSSARTLGAAVWQKRVLGVVGALRAPGWGQCCRMAAVPPGSCWMCLWENWVQKSAPPTDTDPQPGEKALASANAKRDFLSMGITPWSTSKLGCSLALPLWEMNLYSEKLSLENAWEDIQSASLFQIDPDRLFFYLTFPLRSPDGSI